MIKAAHEHHKAFKKRFAGCVCWFCRERPFADPHHVWGRSGAPILVYLGGVKYRVPAYKIEAALCASCHRIAGRYLKALRPLLTEISFRHQPELREGASGE